VQFTFIDWTIIIGYFFIALLIGLIYRRRAGKSMTEFFISGRALPWWLAGTSMVATTFAADTPLGVTGLVAKYGLAGNWFIWCFALGGMFTVFVYARLWRRAEVLTDVELIEMRYSGKPAAFLRGFRAVYVALLVNSIIIGWVTGAMMRVLKYTVIPSGTSANGIEDWVIIAVLLAIVGVYSTLSGLWGVAVTDLIQFVLAMGGCIALSVIAVDHVGGIQSMREQVIQNFPGGEQAFYYLPDFSSVDPWMPLNIFLIMLFVQWWATWGPGMEPGGGGYIVQRMASCKNERHAVLATLWYQIAQFCLRPWPWLLIAFAALAMYPQLRLTDDPSVGFPMVMRDLSPPGLRGLMVVAFFAAYMSTISTHMNWGASYLVNDVYRRFVRPDADEAHLTSMSRLASVFVLFLGGISSWIMRDLSIDEAWKILAALGAGTGAVYMLRWFWWRINAWTEISAMIASLTFFLIVGNFVEKNEHRLAIVAGLTIAVWLAVTFIAGPEKQETLLRFYRKVRPGGPGWYPLREMAPEVSVDQNLGGSVVMALLGSGIVYLTLPGVGHLIFGEYGRAVLFLLGAAACATGIYVLSRRTL
jgi:SSS family solute:Na+ symporter